MGLSSNWYKLGTKHVTYQMLVNFTYKKDITVNKLECEVSSLACKCVFYRPEHNAKGRPLEIEFRGSRSTEMKYTKG